MAGTRWTSDHMGDQTGRVAIVTGANTGIGLPTAQQLARHGAQVIMACRTADKARQAVASLEDADVAANIEIMVLDLADLASVKTFADDFVRRFDRLDLLINNAGVMVPPLSKTADIFELQFGTNHLGHFALTARLLDLLERTECSRVVTVSSTAHRFGRIDFDDLQWESRKYGPQAAYGQSKLANLLFTFELQRRFEAAGATTMAVAAHPGWTGTDLQRHAGMIRAFNPLFGMQPWQGALPTLYAATSDDARGGAYYGPDGWFEMRGYPKQVDSNAASKDQAVARRLWEVSEQLTGVRLQPTARAVAT